MFKHFSLVSRTIMFPEVSIIGAALHYLVRGKKYLTYIKKKKYLTYINS